MSRVLNRYFLRETYTTTSAVAAILMMVYLADRMARLLADVAAGALPGDVVLPLLGYKAVSVLATLLPAAFYLATLLNLGRMHSDSEMTALASAGIGPSRIVRHVLLAALPVALLTALLAIQLRPMAESGYLQAKRSAEREAELSLLEAGRFSESDDGSVVYFIDGISADRSRLRGIFVRQRSGDRQTLIQARSGELLRDEATGERRLELTDGHRYDGWPGRADYRVTRFSTYALRLADGAAGATSRATLKGMPPGALFAAGDRRALAELQWRLSMPLSVLILALLAVPVSRTRPRQGRYARLLAALLAYLVYSNVLILARAWMVDGRVEPWLGLWWVHLLMLGIVALYLLQQQRPELFAARRPSRRGAA